MKKIVFFFVCLHFSVSYSQLDSNSLYSEFYSTMLNNDTKKAEEILTRISEKGTDQFFVLIKRAEFFSFNNDLDSAGLYYSKAIHHLKYAQTSFKEKRFKETKNELYNKAVKNYNKIVDRYPNDAVHLCNRAIFKGRLKLYREAISDYSLSLQIEAHYITYYNRADCYSNIGELDFAIRDYTTSIKLNPEYGSSYINRGYTFLTLEDYPRAIDDLKKSISLSESRIEQSYSFNNIGLAYLKLFEYSEARKYINLSLSINPINAYAYRNLALLEIATENLKSVCENIIKGLELGFTNQYDDELLILRDQYCD